MRANNLSALMVSLFRKKKQCQHILWHTVKKCSYSKTVPWCVAKTTALYSLLTPLAAGEREDLWHPG